MEITVQHERDVPEAARQLLKLAGDRRKFTLTGDLGAGKTTLTQAFCRLLGVTDPVTSPTYSLVNIYHYKDETGTQRLFYHLDLYRLKDIDEALEIGIEDYLEDEHYCFIEWPEIIAPLLPEKVVEIKITNTAGSSRKILIL